MALLSTLALADARATSPTVTSITPINRVVNGVRFEVKFSEPVSGFDDAGADLVILHSGTSHAIASISGGPMDYLVQIGGLTGSGTFTVTANTGSDIEDLDGNPLAGGVSSAPAGFPSGTPIRWTEPALGNWFDAGNWDLGRLPNAIDAIRIENGGRAETVEIFPGDPLFTRVQVLEDLLVGTSAGDGGLYFDPRISMQTAIIGADGGTGDVTFNRSPSVLSGSLIVGVDGGTGTLDAQNFSVASDLNVGFTQSGSALSTGRLFTNNGTLTGSGTNNLFIARSQAAGPASGLVEGGGLAAIDNLIVGFVESSGNADGVYKVLDNRSVDFGGATLTVGLNLGSGRASGHLDVLRFPESGGFQANAVQQLRIGVSAPFSSGFTEASFALGAGSLNTPILVLGDHAGSGGMEARIDLGIVSSGSGSYGVLNTDTAQLNGALNAIFYDVPAAGTHTYTLLNTTQANGITGTPYFQTRNLNRGFRVDSHGVVLDGGVEKVQLQITGVPVESSWTNPATGPSAGDWFDGGNWSRGVAPDSGEPAFINNGGEAFADGSTSEGEPLRAMYLHLGTEGNTGSLTVDGVDVDITNRFDIGYATAPGDGGSSNGTLTLANADFTQQFNNRDESRFDVSNRLATVADATAPTSASGILSATNSRITLGDSLDFGSVFNGAAPVDIDARMQLDNASLSFLERESLDTRGGGKGAGGNRNFVFSMFNGSTLNAERIYLGGQIIDEGSAPGVDHFDVDVLDSRIEVKDGLTLLGELRVEAASSTGRMEADLLVSDSTLQAREFFLATGSVVTAPGASNTTQFDGRWTRSEVVMQEALRFAQTLATTAKGSTTYRSTLRVEDNCNLRTGVLSVSEAVFAGGGGLCDAQTNLQVTDSRIRCQQNLQLNFLVESSGIGSRVQNATTVTAADSSIETLWDLKMSTRNFYADFGQLESSAQLRLMRSMLKVGQSAEIGELTFLGAEVGGSYCRSTIDLGQSVMTVGKNVILAAGSAEATMTLDLGYLDVGGDMHLNPGSRFEFNLSGPTRATAANVVAGGAIYSAVDVGGTLTILGGDLQVSPEAGPLTEPAYVLFTYGALVGTFDNVFGVPSGYQLDYHHNGGTAIALVAGNAPPVVTRVTPSSAGPFVGFDDALIDLEVVFSEPVSGFDALNDLVVSSSGFSSILVSPGSGVITTTDMQTFTVPIRIVWTVPDGVPSANLTFAVSTASDVVSDASGTPLIGSARTPTLLFPATSYQLWAIEQRLTPGVNFGFFQNADGDPWTNGREWQRAGDPLLPDRLIKRVHLVEIAGQKHLAVTVPTPIQFNYLDGGVFSAETAGVLFGGDEGSRFDELDVILSNGDLIASLVDPGTLPLVEQVPAISGPIPGEPALPPLPAGHVYRTFRMVQPVSDFPRAFIFEGPRSNFGGP